MAECMVEDATTGGISRTTLQPFADYGTMLFTNNVVQRHKIVLFIQRET